MPRIMSSASRSWRAPSTSNWGRRAPECVLCSDTVYMSLQGASSGGSWTNNPDEERRGQRVSPEGIRSEESDDGEHIVVPANAGWFLQ
jgi:hypothetical protein